jgi:predicted RNA-binding Zn ribbon-like protein
MANVRCPTLLTCTKSCNAASTPPGDCCRRTAAILFSAIDRSRVRKCDQCVLHFYDISKKGTRRWCSMQLCGNRLKVAAYAARRRRIIRNKFRRRFPTHFMFTKRQI